MGGFKISAAHDQRALSAQRRDEFYFRTAMASRDPDATDCRHLLPYLACSSIAADTRKSKAATRDCRRGYFDNARTVSNIAYVPDERTSIERDRLVTARIVSTRTSFFSSSFRMTTYICNFISNSFWTTLNIYFRC